MNKYQHKFKNIPVAVACLLVAVLFVGPTEGAFGIPDFLEFGPCFNATLQDGFDPVKYQGLWFSIQSVPNEYENARQCNSMNYTWTGDRIVSVGRGVTEDGVKVKQVSELLEEWELREPPHPAYLTVNAPGVPESPYEVLSTDYVTYSCVHSCLETFGFKAEFFWVFGRTPYLSRHYVDICHEKLGAMGVDTNKLVDIPHDETCPYTKKLATMLEKNRNLMIKLGVLDENAPLLPSTPPPAKTLSRPPMSEDETFLEESELTRMADPNSSPPLKTNNIIMPLFVLMAVLLLAVH